jgi:hypothetical protein
MQHVPNIITKAKRPAVLTLGGMVLASLQAADASTSFNKGGGAKEYDAAVGSDSSPNKDINKALYDTGKGMSAWVWGPILAIVLGGVIAWMIVSITKGGIQAAINCILALLFGGLAISVVYVYMIAPSS